MSKPLLSVIIITYNQEKFIEQAIDSVLSQKTTFDFEVLIGNDCSTDNTQNILKKYENIDNVHIYNRRQNVGATLNLYKLLEKAKGEYIAFLEGDDYWTYEYKLETQVKFLKENNEYSGVAHDLYDVDIDGRRIKKHSSNFYTRKKVYTFKENQHGKFPIQINSLVCKNIFKNPDIDSKMIYEIDRLMCDRIIAALVLDFGNIYIMKDIMSSYRVCINRYNKSIFEETIKMLNIVEKLQKRKFLHHINNLNYYRVYLVFEYFVISFIKKEKLDKKEKQEILNYLRYDDIFRIIAVFIEYLKIVICKCVKNFVREELN